MNRVINSCDKSVRSRPAKAIVIGAAGNADVLAKITDKSGEWAHRSIQNVGNNPVYVGIGQDADDKFSFHKVLQSGQELDCSFHGLRVNVYSTLGSTIAILEMTREDMTEHIGIIPGFQQ